jgi:uncharacterized protein (DUF1810 family)
MADAGVNPWYPGEILMADPFELERFVIAQAPVVADVERELAAGHKQSHWMWFVFPQLRGLGHSAMAERYGISSVAEARAYLAHPVLGTRLRAWTALVLRVEGRTARAIFGTPDDLKLRSSMTLFAAAAPGGRGFRDVLAKYFGGEGDPRTIELLGGQV